MIEDSSRKKTDLFAQREIPDARATSGHCPACRTATLQVVHLLNAPDYLICSRCELSFEVAINSGKIRIKNVPEVLGFMEGELRYQWIEPSILEKFFINRLALIEQKIGIVAFGSLSDEEVWYRSVSLYRMGNEPKMVEFIMIQAGATPEQAQAAFIRLKQQSEQDAHNLAQKFRLAGRIIFSIAFAFIVGWALITNLISAQLRQGLANPDSTLHQVILPLQLLNGLPDIIKPRFLKFLPVSVRNTGPQPSECPVSADNAARLFGSSANQWAPINQASGWQMINIGASSTIRVPAKMQVALVDNKTAKVSVFNGPVTIGNVSFAAILCH